MKKYNFTKEVSNKFKSVKELPQWLLNYPELAKQIKVIRETLGMTQKKLAEIVGCTERAIRRIEAGDVTTKITTLKKIAAALQADLCLAIVPQKKIERVLAEKAEAKARELVGLSASGAAIEDQAASKKAIKQEIQTIKDDILNNKRAILW